ncbi:MAG: hypothetical protein WC004_00330 [Candidatus Absconditabacterales bacterium]
MREIIAQLVPYEIYIWIVSLCLIIGGFAYNVLLRIIQAIKDKQKSIAEARAAAAIQSTKKEQLITQVLEEEIVVYEEIETASDTQTDIAHKMLQQIEIELSPEIQITNNLEERERNEQTENIINEQQVEEGSKVDTIKEETKNIVEQPKKTNTTTVEIYNTQTNLEAVNKQKSHFEVLKHEIENLKTRGLRVDYEKKLVEATIDFPDEEYFNTLLGDWYMENRDFKKAQTIYKKIHFTNPLDDKSLYKLGVINLELGDIQAAEYLVTKAKDIKPENPKYYQTLAEIKYNLEKIDECIESMEKAVDLRPTKFEYIEILGKLYKETNNVQLYYKTLLKMNALEPLNQRVKSELQKIQ